MIKNKKKKSDIENLLNWTKQLTNKMSLKQNNVGKFVPITVQNTKNKMKQIKKVIRHQTGNLFINAKYKKPYKSKYKSKYKPKYKWYKYKKKPYKLLRDPSQFPVEAINSYFNYFNNATVLLKPYVIANIFIATPFFFYLAKHKQLAKSLRKYMQKLKKKNKYFYKNLKRNYKHNAYDSTYIFCKLFIERKKSTTIWKIKHKKWWKKRNWFLRTSSLYGLFHHPRAYKWYYPFSFSKKKNFFKTNLGKFLTHSFTYFNYDDGKVWKYRFINKHSFFAVLRGRLTHNNISFRKKQFKKSVINDLILDVCFPKTYIQWFIVQEKTKLLQPLLKMWHKQKIQLDYKSSKLYAFLTTYKKKTKPFYLFKKKNHPGSHKLGYFVKKAAPWLNTLIYKRALFKGTFKPYTWFEKRAAHIYPFKDYYHLRKMYRHKQINWQRSKRVFFLLRKLLFKSIIVKRVIFKKKHNRIKNLLLKINLPYYASLHPNRLYKLYKKEQVKKSVFTNKIDKLLAIIESRLDVIVYRLNYAPSIFWARQLITEGKIFISNPDNFKIWEKYYTTVNHLKYYYFLFKNRKLYKGKKNLLLPSNCVYNYLSKPITTIDYIIKKGDLIQYIGVKKNIPLFFHRKWLKRPVPKYLMISWKGYAFKDYLSQEIAFVSKVRYQKGYYHFPNAVILFMPKFKHLRKKDRLTPFFLKSMLY